MNFKVGDFFEIRPGHLSAWQESFHNSHKFAGRVTYIPTNRRVQGECIACDWSGINFLVEDISLDVEVNLRIQSDQFIYTITRG